MNPNVPEGMIPDSIRTMALISGHLLYFDEVLDVVVTRLEAGRVGSATVELHMDGRRMVLSPDMVKGWFHAWDINPALKAVRGEAADRVNNSLVEARFGAGRR